MSDTNKKIENEKKPEIKQLTLEDLKRVRGGYADGGETENFAEGEGAAWCVAFTDDGNVMRESYVNLIPTPAGGTHESGLKDGLFGAVKGFIELHSLLPKGVKLMPEDVFSRASFVLSAKVLDPQFQGQIKERLNSRDALRLVSAFVKPSLELWLNQHVEWGKKLADLVIRQAQTRQRAAQKVEKRKGSGVAVLYSRGTKLASAAKAALASSGSIQSCAVRWRVRRRPPVPSRARWPRRHRAALRWPSAWPSGARTPTGAARSSWCSRWRATATRPRSSA